MRPVLKFFLIALVLLVVIAGATVFLLQNEGFLKSQLSRVAYEQTGRELRVDGPLTLHLGRTITIEAAGIEFANAPWAEPTPLVRIGNLRLALDTASLINAQPLGIRDLEITDCAIDLRRNAAGEANWAVLPEPDEEPVSEPESDNPPFLISRLHIGNCQLHYDAAERPHPVRIGADLITLGNDGTGRVEGQIKGSLNDYEVAIEGWLSPVRAFLDGGRLQHEIQGSIGTVDLRSSGSIEDASTLSGANIRGYIGGPDLKAVLRELSLPLLGGQEFGLSWTLNTEGRMTRLAIDGDVGMVNLRARGEVDRLLKPGSGQLEATVRGPDLATLGRTMGLEGLADGAFELNGDAVFDPGLVHLLSAGLSTTNDRLDLKGTISTTAGMPSSHLDVELVSDAPERWLGLVGEQVAALGALNLDGQITTDDEGMASINARLSALDSRLEASGRVGPVSGPWRPELAIGFETADAGAVASRFGLDAVPAQTLHLNGAAGWNGQSVSLGDIDLDMGGNHARLNGHITTTERLSGSELEVMLEVPDLEQLGLMFGREDLPPAPLELQGKAGWTDDRLALNGIDINMAGNRVTVDGFLNVTERFSGSKFDVGLNVPDLADLAQLFGKTDWPAEPLELTGELSPIGKGLAFTIDQSKAGQLIFKARGRIEDLGQPLGVDADFDLSLPTLNILAPVLPDIPLPPGAFSASGHLSNEKVETQLQDIRLSLGTIEADIGGAVGHDAHFALDISLRGSDASALNETVGHPLQPEAFSLETRIEGHPHEFTIGKLTASLGRSRVNGDLTIGLGERKRISGALESPYLDLREEFKPEEAEETAVDIKKADSKFVFDDTPTLTVDDYGIDIDAALAVRVADLGNTQLRDLQTHLLLERNLVRLEPFSVAGGGGGSLSGKLGLDARSGVPSLDVDLLALNLKTGLGSAVGQDQSTWPAGDFSVRLAGSGATQRELAASLNGKVRVNYGPGLMAIEGLEFIMSDFLTELFTTLNPFAETSEYTKLECAVAAADIVDGQVSVNPVILNTNQITILSEGSIDLHTEKIDLAFNSRAKKGLGLSAAALINPFLKVGGRLKSPQMELDPGKTVVEGGLAVATAGLSVVAKSMGERFFGSKDPCGDALRVIEERDSKQP